MLAKRLPLLLNPMSREEYLETTAIYSLYNWNEKSARFIGQRPFRSPHHSSSDISITGGGTFPKPGEISLAHNGVLFLDELQEFRSIVLNMLRQPLQDRIITIARSAGSVLFPAGFLLVCAMNSCSCGNFLDETKNCICTPHQIRKYFSKISGPLLDRIDLQIEMARTNHTSFNTKSLNKETFIRQLTTSQNKQSNRFRNHYFKSNGQIPPGMVENLIPLDPALKVLLDSYIQKYHPSSRSIHSTLKVARTIADLAGHDTLKEVHLLEAMTYRTLEFKIQHINDFF